MCARKIISFYNAFKKKEHDVNLQYGSLKCYSRYYGKHEMPDASVDATNRQGERIARIYSVISRTKIKRFVIPIGLAFYLQSKEKDIATPYFSL